MRRLLKPLWFLLALLFLIEAWLWDHLAPAIHWIVDVLPWRTLRMRISNAIAHLSPQATLVVFLIPAAASYFGLELIALWPMAYGRWILALVVLIVAKVIGAAIAAFAFDITRDKLLQMGWFRRGYDMVIRLRAAAHRLADPYLAEMRAWIKRLRPVARSYFARIVQRLRRKAQAASSKQSSGDFQRSRRSDGI